MGTVVNPIYSGMVPGGMNPTGNQLSLLDLPKTGKGTNPLLPQTATTGTSGTISTNPYDIVPTGTTTTTPTGGPSFPANAGPYPSTTNLGTAGSPAGATSSTQFGGFLSGMTNKDISRLFDSLKKTYGDGMAHMILDFLQGGAGFNQQAVNNLLASLQPGIERGEENIMEQFSAMGNRFGSPAALGIGDFLSQVNLNEGQLVTQMYENALNNFMNVMMGTADKTANRIAASPTGLDSILQGIGLGGQAAGAASAGISALNPAADTSVLDAIAAAGVFI